MTASTAAPGLGWPTDEADARGRWAPGLGWPTGSTTPEHVDPIAEEHA